jgi:hypothetical protein
MLSIIEAQQRTERFLTVQMLEALQAIEYALPSFDTEAREVRLADVARSRIQIRHVRGASDAEYLINSFSDELLMQLQSNVHRLVIVYRVPALDALDASSSPFASNGGASAPSMSAGNSAGATPRLPGTLAGAMSKHIATLSQPKISWKTRRSSSIGAPTSCI